MAHLSLVPGTRVGGYTLVSAIGAGGMGEVYRARDTKLNRDVAIKVLLPDVANDPDRLARFSREAQVLASLNHPNIAHIHGLEDADGVRALVMELVEGPTLAERIAHGAIPVDEALPIAKQIAEALEAAHERGIVHRDLKPANIKIKADGTVKVLDFGLAKAMEPVDASSVNTMYTPTVMSPARTEVGIILGTAAYMSPEQARGSLVDKRADLWAFGAVLYEMLTSTRLFDGSTISDTIAAVLTKQPDWTALPAKTPAAIRRLLRRCLEKDRRNRIADAADARLEIEDALTAGGDTPLAMAAGWSPRRIMWRLVLPAVAITALLAGSLAWSITRNPRRSARVVLSIVPPETVGLRPVGTMMSPPQLSPDGSALLFHGSSPGLFVRRLDSLELLKVPGSEMVTNEPFWHGSTRITFPSRAGSAVQLVEVRLPDGAPDVVMKYSANARGGSWSDTGTVILATYGSLLTPGADGAAKVIDVRENRAGAVPLLYPEFIGGTHDFLAWFDAPGTGGAVALATLTDEAVASVTPLFRNETAALYTPAEGGRVLFVKNDNLYQQRLNRTARVVEGEPQLVVRGVASQPALARADFSVADNGTIAWRPGTAALGEVVAFDRRGTAIATIGPAGAIDSVYLSPADEGQLLVNGDRSAWLARVGDVGRGVLPDDVVWRFWSADGRLAGVRQNHLIVRNADGTVESIGDLPRGDIAVWAVSADRRFVLGRMSGRVAWARVAEMSAAGAWKVLTDTDEGQVDASFSPDGHFVLYDGFAEGGVYVQPFPDQGHRQRIAPDGIDPVWRADGKEIVFMHGDAVWSVAVSSSGGAVTFGAPVKLFDGLRRAPAAVAQSRGLAISRDGTRLFFVQAVKQPPGNVIHVLLPPQARE